MAIKKKPAKKAVKKATKKTAKKVVKRPAKKAAKKVVKKATRKYTKRVVEKAKKPRQTRKKKEEQLLPETALSTIDNTAVVTEYNDCKKAAMDFVDSLMASAHDEAQSVESQIQQIGALDLRYSPIPERFAVLMLLGQMGYVATNLGPLVYDLDNLKVMLKADSLRFNHVNRVIVAGIWEDIQDVKAIATVHASTSSEINFDKPRPAYPETYFIGDAEYVRVK